VALVAVAPSAARAQGSRLFGSTTLTLDPAAVEAMAGLGAEVAPLRPSASAGGGIRFPITSFRLNTETNEGSIGHSGGLLISQGPNDVELRRFVVRLRRRADLTAAVGGTRMAILDLDLADATVSRRGRRVTITGVRATLTAAAAEALNTALNTTALADGFVLGTATIRARGTRQTSRRTAPVSLTG
jgi:hypothetical protein